MEHHHPKVALDRTVQLLKVVHFVLKFDHMIMINDIAETFCTIFIMSLFSILCIESITYQELDQDAETLLLEVVLHN